MYSNASSKVEHESQCFLMTDCQTSQYWVEERELYGTLMLWNTSNRNARITSHLTPAADETRAPLLQYLTICCVAGSMDSGLPRQAGSEMTGYRQDLHVIRATMGLGNPSGRRMCLSTTRSLYNYESRLVYAVPKTPFYCSPAAKGSIRSSNVSTLKTVRSNSLGGGTQLRMHLLSSMYPMRTSNACSKPPTSLCHQCWLCLFSNAIRWNSIEFWMTKCRERAENF